MSKGSVYFLIFIGSTIGSYIPVLFHQSFFSAASIIGGLIGSFAGIWAAITINNYF